MYKAYLDHKVLGLYASLFRRKVNFNSLLLKVNYLSDFWKRVATLPKVVYPKDC